MQYPILALIVIGGVSAACEARPETNEAITYCVSITCVLERVFGNGTPKNDGLVDELRKMIELVSIVSVIWTPVPAGRCVAQDVVVEPPATVQAIATAIPPVGGVVPHETPAFASFPIYPVAIFETAAYGDT